MIYFHNHQSDASTAELVELGFIRSYTRAQVSSRSQEIKNACVHVFISPVGSDLEIIQQISASPSKIIILGKVPAVIASDLGLEIEELSDAASTWDQCDAAPLYDFSESSARIRYGALPDGLECHITDRPLLRYDFLDEWNNLGYGHVRTDGSMWSLTCRAKSVSSKCALLASVYQGDENLTVYTSLSTLNQSDILWVNRAVGFIDTQEFRLLETFITNYKGDRLPCLPLIREVPYGYDAMISMRLDCDESIASASTLFELYRDRKIPYSLAVKTAQETSEVDYVLLREIVSQGGSILSHTVNHKNNWGVDMDDAQAEARESKKWILENVKNSKRIEYAVSPFHQNPDYAVQALALEGYKGFISGIICNDPQYLVSRAGEVCAVDDIVTHSQQCMLHGDCLLKNGNDQLAIYKKSAESCIKSGAIFGYLDHPFSERYQYGWLSEKQRIDIHREWIEFLQLFGMVLFESEEKVLDQVRTKASAKIWLENEAVRFDIGNNLSKYPLAYEFKGCLNKMN